MKIPPAKILNDLSESGNKLERNTYAFATIEEHIPKVDGDIDVMLRCQAVLSSWRFIRARD